MVNETSSKLYLIADTGPSESPDSRVTNFSMTTHQKKHEFIFRSHKMAVLQHDIYNA
jgi:hypothetical protein